MKNTFRPPLFLLCLWLSAQATAQAVAKLVVRTDMSCNWKLDGRAMGLLMSDYSEAVPVSSGEHLIESSTVDGMATSRTKVIIDRGEKVFVIQLKREHDDASKEKTDTTLSLIWTDPAARLIWTTNDNGSSVDWNQATAYCSSLKLAGYSGWRLPSIEELEGLYDPSFSVRTVFSDGRTWDMHLKGNLKLTGWLWSETQVDGYVKPWTEAWGIDFSVEKRRIQFPLGFNYTMRALCVRPLGKVRGGSVGM